MSLSAHQGIASSDATRALLATNGSGSGTAGPWHSLGKAVRSGDLDAAKQAYADIVKNPPAGASWQSDGAFAQLGKALAQGDTDGAKAILQQALQEGRGTSRPGPRPTEDPTPAGAETLARAVGSRIHLTA